MIWASSARPSWRPSAWAERWVMRASQGGPVVTLIRQQLPQTVAVYAFGSQVQGRANAQSALDLAVLVAGYGDPLVLWALAGALSDTAACPAERLELRDLRDLRDLRALVGRH